MNLPTAFRRVCARLSLTKSDFHAPKSPKRVEKRRLCYWLLYELTDASWPEIAKVCGKRSHSTALLCAQKVDADPELKERAEAIKAEIEGAGR